jgi:hypothetical protein
MMSAALKGSIEEVIVMILQPQLSAVLNNLTGDRNI